MTIDPRFRALEQALARLETRVAELERKPAPVLNVGACERCQVRHERGRCVNCCRDLCRDCLATETCPNSFSREHHS